MVKHTQNLLLPLLALGWFMGRLLITCPVSTLAHLHSSSVKTAARVISENRDCIIPLLHTSGYDMCRQVAWNRLGLPLFSQCPIQFSIFTNIVAQI